ncbi:hydroxylysine kinase-like [Mytilus trossulus]|uniref:hydroxylysine kinase-like n=1 Tax=Mytilus trossulus TaxID=6551 RepID=UPI003005337C
MNSEENMSNRKSFEGDLLLQTKSNDENQNSEEFMAVVRQYHQMKPNLPPTFVKNVTLRLYGMTVVENQELDSYDDFNYHITVDQVINNDYINDFRPAGYVLKVLNYKDSQNNNLIEAMHFVLNHLKRKSFPVQAFVSNVYGEMWSSETIVNKFSTKQTYIVSMMTYLEGKTMTSEQINPSSLYNIGIYAGLLQKALEDFDNDFLTKRENQWDLLELPKLVKFTPALEHKEEFQLLKIIMTDFKKEVVPVLEHLTKVLIHGDLNDGNILVKEVMKRKNVQKEKTTYDIVGIIDFLDMQYSYTIVDIAILIAHMSAECTCMDPIDVGGHILAGYMTIKELTHNEKDILRLLICSRLAQLIILNEFTLLIDPHKKSVRLYLENYKRIIWKFWKTSKTELYRRWDVVLRDNNIENVFTIL